MIATPVPALSFRSYDAEYQPHTHDDVQIVLPLLGTMEIDIERRGQRLNHCLGAVVSPGFRHGQLAHGANRFFVVDCGSAAGVEFSERFAFDPYFPISPALRRLIDFIDLSATRGDWLQTNGVLCLPLLLDAIGRTAGVPSRLDALTRLMKQSIGQRWAVADMAQVAGVSISRLHSLFKLALGQSPNRYLASLRVNHALHLLSSTETPLCQIAQEVGYSDQSALTRAMRKALGVTPARYRRREQ